MLAPYLHGKHGIIPAPIYLDVQVHLPHPNLTKLEQVRDNIIYLSNLKLSAQIDTATADNLIADQRHLHDSIFGGTDVTIKIEGGLPDMLVTNIIAPSINGNDPHTLLDSDHGRVDAPRNPWL
jgi:hypothetical protein